MFPKQTETCGRRMNKCEVSRESGGSGKLPIILCISNVLKVGQVMIGGRQGGWHAEMDGHTEMLKGDNWIFNHFDTPPTTLSAHYWTTPFMKATCVFIFISII